MSNNLFKFIKIYKNITKYKKSLVMQFILENKSKFFSFSNPIDSSLKLKISIYPFYFPTTSLSEIYKIHYILPKLFICYIICRLSFNLSISPL